jgi:hypothetical protein
VDSNLNPQREAASKDSGQDFAGGFAVTRGDASEVLEFIEEALDEVALSVEGAVDRALDPCGQDRSGCELGRRGERPDRYGRARHSRDRR